jgi:putative SbcD/Mre11-related phosphoesterase
MPPTTPGQVYVAHGIILDGRLALYHEIDGWLAVADLHFGYELSQRAAGRLMPLWGMQSIEDRLADLLDDYQPRQLIIAGDLMHNGASLRPSSALLARLRQRCEVTVLSGNHDRHAAPVIALAQFCEKPGFVFHHGNAAIEKQDRIQIIGHHHPAAYLRDGAGLRLKFPAFVQQPHCWVLPAFSPWAGGVVWPDDGESCIWLCTPQRVLRVDGNSAAASLAPIL